MVRIFWFWTTMGHFLYILHSNAIDRFYIGETPDIQTRLQQHLEHHFKTNFTKAANDWEVVLSKECGSRDDALYLERFIKRMKSKKFIVKIIENPQILDDLLDKK